MIIDEPKTGCFFADPNILPGEYRPAKKIDINAALAYAKRVNKEENREVTFEEMQKFISESIWHKGSVVL